jgi:acyl-coenzyme A synthetase/AMP-(fatty) acid ligase
MRGEIVKAFIALSPGYEPGEALKKELQDFVKQHLAKHEYPREIEFISEIPKTTTGKIRRKDLRERRFPS